MSKPRPSIGDQEAVGTPSVTSARSRCGTRVPIPHPAAAQPMPSGCRWEVRADPRSVSAVGQMPELPPRRFPAAPDEVEALLGALHRNRRTFAWKTGGLDADAMRSTLGPSTITCGGLVKHLALVEDHYFTHQLLGREYPAVWAPLADDDDWEWHSAADDSPEGLRALWLQAVDRSEAAVREAIADGGLDRRVLANPEGAEAFTLRRVLIDMIEEYARHTGHADLIRESIDGLVGEDPPS